MHVYRPHEKNKRRTRPTINLSRYTGETTDLENFRQDLCKTSLDGFGAAFRHDTEGRYGRLPHVRFRVAKERVAQLHQGCESVLSGQMEGQRVEARLCDRLRIWPVTRRKPKT